MRPMTGEGNTHQPVLLRETVEALGVKPQGRYVDGTLGLGGHAEEILKQLGPNGRLLGLDVDREAMALAERRLQPFGDMVITRLTNFRGLQSTLHELKWEDADGMVFDLGVSSLQLDDARRGFSFWSEAPLDMRLDPDQPETALARLKKMDDRKLAEWLAYFGEERHARRLSQALLSEAGAGRLKTTLDLARLCEKLLPRRGKTHPATRVFLALRCLVNDEMGALQDMLEIAPRYLATGGRLAVISFHSIEDKMVKDRFRTLAGQGLGERRFSLLTKKPVEPTDEECRRNPRARSAKLRVLERLA